MTLGHNAGEIDRPYVSSVDQLARFRSAMQGEILRAARLAVCNTLLGGHWQAGPSIDLRGKSPLEHLGSGFWNHNHRWARQVYGMTREWAIQKLEQLTKWLLAVRPYS